MDSAGARALLRQRIGAFTRVLFALIGALGNPGVIERVFGPNVLSSPLFGAAGLALIWLRNARGVC